MALRLSPPGKTSEWLDWYEEPLLKKSKLEQTNKDRPSSNGKIIEPGALNDPALNLREPKQIATDKKMKKTLLSLSNDFKEDLLLQINPKLWSKLHVSPLPKLKAFHDLFTISGFDRR